MKLSNNIFDNIFLALFVHLFGYAIFQINQIIGSSICLMSVIYMIICILKRARYSLRVNKLAGVLIITYLFLDFTCVILQSYLRGEPIWEVGEINSFMSYHFVVNNAYLAYVLPFCFLLDTKNFTLRGYCKYAYLATIAAFFVVAITAIAEGISTERLFIYDIHRLLSTLIPSITLYVTFYGKKVRLACICLIAFALLYAIFGARRGMSLTYTIMIVLMIDFRVYRQSRRKRMYQCLFLIGCVAIYFTPKDLENLVPNNELTEKILNKGMLDNRSGIEDGFFDDMFNSDDILFGRGINGTYTTYVEQNGKFLFVSRKALETGYWYIWLIGGGLFVNIYVILLIYSGVKGILKGKNSVVQFMGCTILLSVAELYPYGLPTFSPKYFLIYMGVILCNQKLFVFMDDETIRKKLALDEA